MLSFVSLRLHVREYRSWLPDKVDNLEIYMFITDINAVIIR